MSQLRPAPYVAIAGPIGVGKSSVARLVTAALEAAHDDVCELPPPSHRLRASGYMPVDCSVRPSLVEEVFADNPFLERFYQPGGLQRWGLAAAVHFLPERFDAVTRIDDLLSLGHTVVTDWVVQQTLVYARLSMSDLEYAAFEGTFNRLMRRAPAPDLLVLLDAEPDALVSRVAGRGRSMEQTIDPAYLRALRSAYREWHDTPPVASPVLAIDTTHLSVPGDPDAQAEIVHRITSALAAVRQITPARPTLEPSPAPARRPATPPVAR